MKIRERATRYDFVVGPYRLKDLNYEELMCLFNTVPVIRGLKRIIKERRDEDAAVQHEIDLMRGK